jgi:signal transduction histidine kinase
LVSDLRRFRLWSSRVIQTSDDSAFGHHALGWPRSLAGRTLLLLVVTMVVVSLGGILAYRLLAQDAAERGRLSQIADRLGTAMVTLAELPPHERGAAARALSSASFRIAWSATSLVDDASAGDAGLLELRRRLIELTPELSSRELHLRWDEHAYAGRGTVLLGAAELADRSYANFSAAIIPAAVPSLPGLLLVALVVFASIIVVAVLVLHTINAPLRRLADAARSYGHGQPVHLAERGPREIVEVKRAFNAMQDHIHRLITDRTQALAAVSHDLRTPIARLRLRCELLPDRSLRTECERDLAEMESMVEATLAYLRGNDDAEPPRPVDLASMLTTLVDATVDAGGRATLSGPGHAVAIVRGLGVKRSLANLIGNAVTYGGCARVGLEQAPKEIRIVIDDDGPGISDADMQRVFEPFHRLEASRNSGTGGVGLGLTIARQAVEREGGSIRLCNRPGGGLRVEVRLPLHRDEGKATVKPTLT